MGVIRIIVLVGAAISLAISIVWSILTRMPRAARGPARKQLSSANWLGDEAKDGDLVKLNGVVRTRDGERLMSPISNIRCVALRIRAQARRGLDPRAKYVEKIDYKPFELEDAQGMVSIEPTEVRFDIPPLKSGKPDASGRAKVLADLGHPNANSTKSNIEETVLEVGATVTIAGTLATVDGRHRLVGVVACMVDRSVDRSNEP